MLPFVIFLSYFLGGWIMGVKTSNLHYIHGLGLQWIKDNLLQYLIGSLVLGLLLALVFGTVSYFLLAIFRKKDG